MQGQARVLSAVPRWTGPSVLGLIAAAVLGAVAGMLVEVGEYATGPARVEPDGVTFTAVLPEAALSPLKHGQRLDIREPSGTHVTVATPADSIRPVDDATAAQLLGPQGSDALAGMSRSVVAVQGRLPASSRPPRGGLGDARVRVKSRPFLKMLLSGLNPAAGAP